MIKVAIIGCGKIADLHAWQIQQIANTEIVGVCDNEELMAKQLSERIGIKYYFTDVTALLNTTHPDVVHITTPPQSHFKLGKLCLEAGSNVFMEKPFTINTAEAEALIALAEQKKVKITVDHDYKFNHVAVAMRELIKNDFLGGPPVHIESTFCYDIGDVTYAKALLGDKQHWVRNLPGKLLHNIISHGLSLIAEFLTGDDPKVIAHGFASPLLKKIGETSVVDELRVIIHDSNDTTAYFTFSSQIGPQIHQFCIYGPKNGIIIDNDHQILIKINKSEYKSYLNQFIPPYIYAKQYFNNFKKNIMKFIKNDFNTNYRYKILMESFYKSVLNNEPLPISYKEIILTSKIMDNIFSQLNQ